MKHIGIVLGALAVVFLMVSTGTAVPQTHSTPVMEAVDRLEEARDTVTELTAVGVADIQLAGFQLTGIIDLLIQLITLIINLVMALYTIISGVLSIISIIQTIIAAFQTFMQVLQQLIAFIQDLFNPSAMAN
jgi:hypothetical protein